MLKLFVDLWIYKNLKKNANGNSIINSKLHFIYQFSGKPLVLYQFKYNFVVVDHTMIKYVGVLSRYMPLLIFTSNKGA